MTSGRFPFSMSNSKFPSSAAQNRNKKNGRVPVCFWKKNQVTNKLHAGLHIWKCIEKIIFTLRIQSPFKLGLYIYVSFQTVSLTRYSERTKQRSYIKQFLITGAHLMGKIHKEKQKQKSPQTATTKTKSQLPESLVKLS